jgi:LmbE family N-acetylglucosaminyl deacetylase
MQNLVIPASLPSGDDADLRGLLESPSGSRMLHIVCVGAHPDDAESGCGGTLAKLAGLGHQVTILCLTRGEAGIRDSERHVTATIRTAEAERGSKLIGARIVFANQIDGQTDSDVQRSFEFSRLLSSLTPDIVFTHWPLDTHRDHRTASVLAYEAWQRSGESFTLVYYEVMTGIQTHHFEPNHFVDVSSTHAQKRDSIYAHESQGPGRFYPYHEEMEKRRGEQSDAERAEAFFVVRKKLREPYFAVAV